MSFLFEGIPMVGELLFTAKTKNEPGFLNRQVARGLTKGC